MKLRRAAYRLALPFAVVFVGAVGCSSILGADFDDVHPPDAATAGLDAGCRGDACGACISAGGSCEPSTRCCGAEVCHSQHSKCEACGVAGGACGTTLDCCAGFACDQATSTCRASATCGTDGTTCVGSAGCCSGVCNQLESKCDECGTAGKNCLEDGDCCGGFACDPTTSTCVASSTCLEQNEHCSASSQCCSSLVCSEAFSETCQTCAASGGPCKVDGDCCTGTACNLTTNECEAPTNGCGLSGSSCQFTANCCQGLYCDFAAGATSGNKTCTATPHCKKIGDATCADTDAATAYSSCCEGDVNMQCCESVLTADCTGGITGCCIDTTVQQTDQIKCFQNADCCSNSCNTTSGKCN